MIRRIQSLRGLKVAALDDDAGRISDVYFDEATWRIRYLVADTGWLTGIHALIPPRLVLGVNERLHQVDVNMTRLQIERSPRPDSELPAFAQLHEMQYAHLANMYLGFGEAWPAVPVGSFNPHIRSAHHLTGFHVSATDGDLGLVIDLLVEDTDWTIPYLLADSRHWRMGRPRLVPTGCIEQVELAKPMVRTRLSREELAPSSSASVAVAQSNLPDAPFVDCRG